MLARHQGDHMAEPLNATFFAFRKRERGGVLLRASIAFIVVALLLYAAFIAVFWAQLGPIVSWYADMITIAASGQTDPSAMQGMTLPEGIGAMALGGIVWLFFFCVLYAAYEAACLKWMIHGETGGFMGLSLGADTWRIYSTYWLWFALYLGFSIVMAILLAIVMMVIAMTSLGGGGDPTAMFVALPVYYVIHYGLMIYFGTRFAPAAATSIARRKFSFFQAWTVTKGRFWALFGAFFLLFLIYLVWMIAYFAIWVVAVAGPVAPDLSTVNWSDGQQMYQTYMEFMQAYIRSMLEPRTWVVLGALQVVSWIAALFLYLAVFGINARAAQAALEEGKIQPA
jgi:hypothetical protein